MGEVDWGRKPLTNFKSFRAFGWLDISPGALRAMLKNTPNLEVCPLLKNNQKCLRSQLIFSLFKDVAPDPQWRRG